ncbi:MAG: starvation-sensing protein RspA [Bryobacterales bacterium]|nr:starvation-sensing protein RspA [Bryobacterales bacterium]
MPSPVIKDISVIATQPANARLVVVKVTTDQAGLYGYGCATFTQRADLVVPAVEKYLRPLLIGRPADRIDDTWQMMYNSSYWRNGPVLNNAISGVDEALWDIKGRQAGMPVYQLLGGKMREGAEMLGGASGADEKEVIDNLRRGMANGFRTFRVNVGGGRGAGRGGAAAAPARSATRAPGVLHDGQLNEPGPNLRRLHQLFSAIRKEMGFEVGLANDMHERYPVQMAVPFVKECEQYRLAFLEDPLSPEDIAWFRMIRAQCTTPIAMGELFNSPHEWTPLITERLIDYIRIHLSQAGGVTPCRKIAILSELFGVQTAWHGPGDVSPVGHTAQLHLDLASYNFGFQEGGNITGVLAEMFKGCATFKDGYLFASDLPGWGIEVDEKLAAKYPFRDTGEGPRRGLNGGWGDVRLRDGTVVKQ